MLILFIILLLVQTSLSYDYGKRTVSVVNKANAQVNLWCASADNHWDKILAVKDTFSFSFNPTLFGETIYWCTTNYNVYWARWDVFGLDAEYGLDNDDDKIYEYYIQDDGIYYKGNKIRGLSSGDYHYTLWKSISAQNVYDTPLEGYVNSGMCNDIPGFLEAQVGGATICNKVCIKLFKDLHCSGDSSTLQAESGCTIFTMERFKARSLQGCWH